MTEFIIYSYSLTIKILLKMMFKKCIDIQVHFFPVYHLSPVCSLLRYLEMTRHFIVLIKFTTN